MRQASSRPPIWARFQSAGAEKERKKRRWLFRTPRHHAARIISPAIGKRMRTSCVVSASAPASSDQPGTTNRVSQGANKIPTPLSTAASTSRRPRMVPAKRRASDVAFRARAPL